MKKLLTLMLALCLLGSFALAEEASVITYEDVQPMIEQMEGNFVLLEQLGLQIWLPSELVQMEVSEEDAAAGRYALFMDEEQTGYLAIDCMNVEGMTLDQFYANALESAAKEVELVTINGLGAVVYVDEENNLLSATLIDTNSNLINFIMGPASEEGAKESFALIMASLQAAE